MDKFEIAQIIGFVHALCPAQKINEFTPDAWELVLEDFPFEEARAALKILGQRLRFIAPSDIATEIRHVRNTRTSFAPGTGPVAIEADIPDCDADNVPGYLRMLREGRFRTDAGQLERRFDPAAIEASLRNRSFVYIPSKRPRTNAPTSEPQRPMLAIEAAPAAKPEDPELAVANAVLDQLPTRQHWIETARCELEAAGRALNDRDVMMRAAGLATTTEPGGPNPTTR